MSNNIKYRPQETLKSVGRQGNSFISQCVGRGCYGSTEGRAQPRTEKGPVLVRSDWEDPGPGTEVEGARGMAVKTEGSA